MEALKIDVDSLQERVSRISNGTILSKAGLEEVLPLAGSWIAGRDELLQWSEGAPIESRNRPQIEFKAPLRRIGQSEGPSQANLLVLHSIATPIDRASFTKPWEVDTKRTVERYRRSILATLQGAQSLLVGDPVSALSHYQRALQETPDWQWVAVNLEELFLRSARQGKEAFAQKVASELLKSPSFAHLGHYHLAVLSARAGRQEEAIENVQKALRAKADHGPSRELLSRLKPR